MVAYNSHTPCRNGARVRQPIRSGAIFNLFYNNIYRIAFLVWSSRENVSQSTAIFQLEGLRVGGKDLIFAILVLLLKLEDLC